MLEQRGEPFDAAARERPERSGLDRLEAHLPRDRRAEHERDRPHREPRLRERRCRERRHGGDDQRELERRRRTRETGRERASDAW